MVGRLRRWAFGLKRDVLALWFCYRDPRTPLLAKLLAMAVVAYAFSPIDLIPDFIPLLGYVDELVLLPGAIYLVLKLIPDEVLRQGRATAVAWFEARRPKPIGYVAAAVVVLIWLALAWLAWHVMAPLFAGEAVPGTAPVSAPQSPTGSSHASA